MIYRYARVSTGGQSEAAQVRQLRAAGAAKVFREVASGAKTDRSRLRRLLVEIGPGDVVMVTRLDRLARSTRDLLNTLATITGKKAGFQARLRRSRFSDIEKLRAGIGSSKAEHGPLIVPSQRQTRLYQQLVCGQPARLAPVENGSRDVRGRDS